MSHCRLNMRWMMTVITSTTAKLNFYIGLMPNMSVRRLMLVSKCVHMAVFSNCDLLVNFIQHKSCYVVTLSSIPVIN